MADDLSIATDALAQEAAILEQLTAQALAGDVTAKSLLPNEVQTAKDMKALYAGIDGLNTQRIDTAILAAQVKTTVTGWGAGLPLGPITIPWIGVALLGGLWFLVAKSGNRSRS